MNLSTADAVEQLRQSPVPPQASVSWWHLLADNAGMDTRDPGWRVCPSIGTPADRLALQQAVVEAGGIGISLHHIDGEALTWMGSYTAKALHHLLEHHRP